MNIRKQLSEFCSSLDYKHISSSAIAVYNVLLNIADRSGVFDEFKVANNVLMSKCKLTISSLQRARSELIENNYIKYKRGKNQNEVSTYSIKKLYVEQANEQAHEQADEQARELANEHIINKIKYIFNYLNNINAREEEISKKDKQAIISILKQIDVYVRKQRRSNTEFRV